jgi:hypothetical protein
VKSLWAASHVPSAAYCSVRSHLRQCPVPPPQSHHVVAANATTPAPTPPNRKPRHCPRPVFCRRWRREVGDEATLRVVIAAATIIHLHRPPETIREGGGTSVFLHFPATIRDMEEALSDCNKHGRACMRCCGFRHRWKRNSTASPITRYRFGLVIALALH